MKGFSKRERRIISYAYNDAARICWERESEAVNDGWTRKQSAKFMAGHLKELMPVRAEQILKYGCGLPRTRRLPPIPAKKGRKRRK